MNNKSANQDFLQLINAELNSFFEKSILVAAEIDPSYERLWRGMYTLIQSGGKRLRPQMVLMTYEAFGGKDSASIIPVAAAQELLHFSLLIHDDIIDRDYVRYGVPNITGQSKIAYSEYFSSKDDLLHFANGSAIIAGDLMLSGAYRLIAGSSLPAETIASVQQLLSVGILGVAGGQLLDTEFSFMPYQKGGALKVAAYKTASYSFITPLLIGATLAGASSRQKSVLKEYAKALGIAYQLTDDLLGVFGDEAMTGKSSTGDITEGKRTYLAEMAFDAFTGSEEATFMQAFGNPSATEAEVKTAKQLLISSGAKQQTERKIAEYADSALEQLATLQLADEHHQQLTGMVSKATNRTY